jgi:LmbE family N-acetylglucosaminyl deacetylase
VVYLTEGAPLDPQFRSPHVSGSRELYACVRAEEAASALSFVDLPPERMLFLSGVDQEAIFRAAELIQELVPIIQEFKPAVIVTHPYEGGHPDHDTAALVARVSARIAGQSSNRPDVLEMTSYHWADGKRVAGQFLVSPPALDNYTHPPIRLKLSPEERTRKARMLGCYVSQWHVLSDFPLEPEQLRRAPVYDFTRPPHEGQLWYESLHWPLNGSRWRQLAAQALTELGEFTCQ